MYPRKHGGRPEKNEATSRNYSLKFTKSPTVQISLPFRWMSCSFGPSSFPNYPVEKACLLL